MVHSIVARPGAEIGAEITSPALTQESSARVIAGETRWQAVLAAFLNAGVDSPNTRRAYQRACVDACQWLGIQSLAEVTGAMLAGYRANVLARPSLGPAAKGQILYAVRSFLKWSGALGAHRLTWEVIATALRAPRAIVDSPFRTFSEEELARVWAEGRKRPVTHALLCLALGAGLRVSEISALKISDLYPDLEGGPAVFVSQGKGGKDRVVPLQPEHFQGIADYLEATGRTLQSAGRVFRAEDAAAASRGGPSSMSTSGLYCAFKRLLGRAHLDGKRRGPHVLRHQYAITVLRHSHDVVVVQHLLGHSNLSTTSRYLDHLKLADLRAALPQRLEGMA